MIENWYGVVPKVWCYRDGIDLLPSGESGRDEAIEVFVQAYAAVERPLQGRQRHLVLRSGTGGKMVVLRRADAVSMETIK